jgi:hypothetical protein
MQQQELPRLIALTIEEVKSQSPSVRRKVRRALLHNADILFAPQDREQVKDRIRLSKGQAGAPDRNAGNAKPST